MSTRAEEIYRAAVDFFGAETQICQWHEEAGELQAAVNQHRRGRVVRRDVCEEIADCQIVLEQLAIIYGKKTVDKIRAEKIARLAKMVSG